MVNNLSYLNSRVWYRFIKVVYITFFSLSLIFINIVNFGNGFREIDLNKTIIACNYQDKKVFTPKNIDIGFSTYDFDNDKFDYEKFFRGYNEQKIFKILQNCYTPEIKNNTDVYLLQRHYEITGFKEDKKIYDQIFLESEIQKISNETLTNYEKADLLDFSIKFFEVRPSFTHIKFIEYLLIGNFSIFIFFEILRHIFYYVVLGTFRPKV